MALTQKRLKECVRYNAKTGEITWISREPRHIFMLGRTCRSRASGRNGRFYYRMTIDGKAYNHSHLAYLYMTGKFPRLEVDHKNGDSLDDRWRNLRLATHAQNMANIKHRSRKNGLPMGVTRVASGRFRALIGKGRKYFHLGTFDNMAAAKSAYDKKRKELFGRFA